MKAGLRCTMASSSAQLKCICDQSWFLPLSCPPDPLTTQVLKMLSPCSSTACLCVLDMYGRCGVV